MMQKSTLAQDLLPYLDMATILQLHPPNHFGDCPKCKKNDGRLNVGREHWFICLRHRVKWRAGYDLFPDWRQENLHIWRQNERLLDLLMEVEPIQAWKKTLLEEMFLSYYANLNNPCSRARCRRHATACLPSSHRS